MYAEDRDKARRLLDDESKQMITPYLSQRDGLSAELAKLEERRRQITHAIKVRNLNMYRYMFNIAERAQNNDLACQISLVDNDVPPQPLPGRPERPITRPP
jgi:hypothetical protein